MNIFHNLNPEAAEILSKAMDDGKSRQHNEIRSLHLAARLFLSPNDFVKEICLRCSVSPEDMGRRLLSVIDGIGPAEFPHGSEPSIASDLRDVIEDALTFTKARADIRIGVADLFTALMSDYKMQILLPNLGLDSRRMLFRALDVLGQAPLPSDPKEMLCKELEAQIQLANQILAEANRNLSKMRYYLTYGTPQ